MRPRVIPAEDLNDGSALERLALVDAIRFNEAAGYPRGRPRTCGASEAHCTHMLASMRPRVIPAEDGPLAKRCDADH